MNPMTSRWTPHKPCAICRQWCGEVLSLHNGVAVIRCRNCHLYYVDAVPHTEEEQQSENLRQAEQGLTYLQEVYEKRSTDWSRYYRTWVRRIESMVGQGKLLDVGCGPGLLVKTACQMGWDAQGIDTSADAIAYGQEHWGLRQHLRACMVEELDPSAQFDVITAFSVIEHVDDPLQFVIDIRRLLRPKGLVLIKTPSQSSLVTRIHWTAQELSRGKVGFDLYSREHIYRFSASTLKLLLEKAGYEQVAMYFDDQLWITATRALLGAAHRTPKFWALATLHSAGKLFRAENQIMMIARRAD